MLNLLSNAAKFTENGLVNLNVIYIGQLDTKISAYLRENLASSVLVNDEHQLQGGVAFEVIDTGIGLTTEQMTKIFEPFERADNSTTRRYEGTGLGLSISKRFCELMGGAITVASEIGEGSTFTAYFPLVMGENTFTGM
ncbi:ATP-binding protein [Arthrospira sp. PCC 9108]|nr:ATP-binding protein [Arthrospira sp. PCC 9108]